MHRVRLYPTPSQEVRLAHMLHVTRHLYNALLDERKYAWTSRRISLKAKDQYAELTALRREDPVLAGVYRECEDAVLHRLDLAYQAFFRRVKRGETPGHPRFRPASRWNQLEFPHGDRAIRLNSDQTKATVPGVGTVRLRKGREVPEYGRVFVVRKNARWWTVFECERDQQPLPLTGKALGIDRGVHVLAATSDAELIRNAAVGERARSAVTRLARELEGATVRDARGRVVNYADPKRRRVALRLARAHERVANARKDSLHKIAVNLVRSADVLVFEKLSVRHMTRSAKGSIDKPGRNVRAKAGLNRRVLDAGFTILRRFVAEKAEYAARQVSEVDARYSSQTCYACGHVAAENRRRRRFCCVRCGWSTHADVAAALEIRRRAELAPMMCLMPVSSRLTLHDVA
jgi:putative transposase